MSWLTMVNRAMDLEKEINNVANILLGEIRTMCQSNNVGVLNWSSYYAKKNINKLQTLIAESIVYNDALSVDVKSKEEQNEGTIEMENL